jgi:hypothetical protein
MGAKTSNKRYAYLVLDVVIDDKGLESAAGYECAFSEGEVLVREDNPGLGGHDFTFDDGPLTIHLTCIYVGTGTTDADGDVTFDYATSRLLQLCKIAWEKEQFLNRMIHETLDKAKAVIEEALMGNHFDGSMEDVVKSIDTLEKELVK